MKGLGYLTVLPDGSFKGPIDKFLVPEKKAELNSMLNLKTDDTLFFISDNIKVVNLLAGQIRTALGERLEIIDKDRFDMCFITDFPMYEKTDEGKLDFTHNPFSMPQGGMDALENQDPLTIKAYQYDIVCNGVELSSGAVRNHRPDIMIKHLSSQATQPMRSKSVSERCSAHSITEHRLTPVWLPVLTE